MAGGGSSSGSTAYSNKGTTEFDRSKQVPTYISDLVTSNAQSAAPNPALVGKQQTLFSNLMDKTDATVPGYSKFNEIMGQSTTSYPGATQLATFAGRNPYDGAYEAATLDSFKQRSADALAQVSSGPDAVRGGASRNGIAQGVAATRLAQERGHEVRAAQQQDVGVVQDAIKTQNQVELGKGQQVLSAAQSLAGVTGNQQQMQLGAARAVDVSKLNNLGLLQLAAGLQGTSHEVKTDNTHGEGSQEQGGWHAGLDCCFIFLQALNGKLPWYIELARRDYYTVPRKRGYKWMSRWLVPLMRIVPCVQHTVNRVVIKPFLVYGKWIYTRKGAGWLLAPYCHAWLGLWGTIGRIVKKG